MLGTSYSNDGAVEVYPGLIHVRTGGKLFAVHHSGASALDGLPSGLASNVDGFFTSVNSALNACRSGYSDRVLCLRRHTENIGAADAWSALGTKTDVEVISLAQGLSAATFTWTVAGSTLLMDAEGFAIRGCRMFLAGAHAAGSALTVAAPITMSAAGVQITDCEGYAGFDVDQIVTVGITTTAAADDMVFARNRFFGTATAIGTTFLRLVGADRARIFGNRIAFATSAAAVGPIQCLTTASLELEIKDNFIHNNAASSTACITGMAGAGGEVSLNRLRNEDGASLAHIANTSAIWSQFENYGVNVDGERGAILGVVSA